MKRNLDGIEYEVNLFGDIIVKNDADYIKLAQKDINKIKYFPSEKFSDGFTIKLYDVLANYIVKKISCLCQQKLTRSEIESFLTKTYEDIEEIRKVIISKHEEYHITKNEK